MNIRRLECQRWLGHTVAGQRPLPYDFNLRAEPRISRPPSSWSAVPCHGTVLQESLLPADCPNMDAADYRGPTSRKSVRDWTACAKVASRLRPPSCGPKAARWSSSTWIPPRTTSVGTTRSISRRMTVGWRSGRSAAWTAARPGSTGSGFWRATIPTSSASSRPAAADSWPRCLTWCATRAATWPVR